MKIFSVEEMVAAEKAADQAGHSYAAMMEQAGGAFAQQLIDRFDPSQNILVLSGGGNNGGDGLVAARYLHQSGHDLTVLMMAKRDAEDDVNYAKLLELGITILEPIAKTLPDELEHILTDCDAIVDALFGTGLSRPIVGIHADLLEAVGRARQLRPIFLAAVDCPSGINCDTGQADALTLDADLTISFQGAKQGHFFYPAADYLGELIVVDIGISPAITAKVKTELATEEFVCSLLPHRPKNGYKGTFGNVLIAAGSKLYRGAPYLSALAAFRTGSGLVNVLTTTESRELVSTKLAESIVPEVGFESILDRQETIWLHGKIDQFSAVAIGPGLSDADYFVHESLRSFQQLDVPLLFDADALNTLSRRKSLLDNLPKKCVLTPHPGEMARLLDMPLNEFKTLNRIEVTREMAKKWRCVILLKGAHTVIANPDGQVMVLPFANPLMAVAGSGDVLSGVIVSLLGQGLPPFEAAVLGGWLHGVAAELAKEQFGDRGMLASELADLIPAAIQKLKQ
ncbi:MAG: NAD(P)H-hydrate dehydratase [Chloroflexota bacterium]